MGFYIRKGINVGPFRFNLSKSGVGVSAGVTGFRVGAGPSGNYVHAGRHGLYFRKQLGSGSKRSRSKHSAQTFQQSDAPAVAAAEDPSIGAYQPIDSGDVTAMRDASSAELLDEIAAKRGAIRCWPLALSLTAPMLAVFVAVDAPDWLGLTALAAWLGFVVWCWQRDVARRTVVIMYDLEAAYSEAYERFYDAFERLAACEEIWHIAGAAPVVDEKYHSGADTVLRRRPIALKTGQLPGIRTNIDIPQIPVGEQTLAFLPDQLLVLEKESAGAVPYDALNVRASVDERPVHDYVARDTEVVGQTWRYVNQDGTPDKRFRDNAPVAICAYGDLTFQSQNGLLERIQCSHANSAKPFAEALAALGRL